MRHKPLFRLLLGLTLSQSLLLNPVRADALQQANQPKQIRLQLNARVVYAHQSGPPPLFQAILDRNPERFRALLEAGEPIEQRQRSQTPLMWAAGSGQVKMVRLLLEQGAETDTVVQSTLPALHRAARKGHLATVKALLEYGASVDFISYDGSSALWEAVKHGQYQVVRVLLEQGADAQGQTLQLSGRIKPLTIEAAQQSDARILKALAQAGADIRQDYKGWTPLMYAAISGQTEMLSYLLEQGLSANETTPAGWTPLMAAASGAQIETLQFLAEQGAETAGRPGWKALLQAVFTRQPVKQADTVQTVRWLLARGARYDAGVPTPDQRGYAELLVAAASNVTEWALALLEAGADPNQQGQDGWTPLMWAALRDNQALVEALLTSGATVNHRSSDGLFSALDMALGDASAALVKRLLALGATLDETNRTHFPSLFKATRQEEHLKLLIQHGANLNARNDSGKTALIWAVEQYEPAAIPHLLAAGADPSLRDETGKTALDYALAQDNPLLICLLMQSADPETAQQVYAQAGIQDPEAELAKFQRNRSNPPQRAFAKYLEYGDRNVLNGDFNSAFREYHWAQQHADAQIPENQTLLLLRLGWLQLLSWRFDEAEASAQQALELSPSQIRARLLLAHVLLCRGQQTAAQQQYSEILQASPAVLQPAIQQQIQAEWAELDQYGLLPVSDSM